jgi:hypothetical protein
MKGKWKEIVDIFDEDEVLPIGVLLKKDTIETWVQNSAWKYQGKATWIDTEWVEIKT